MSSEGERFKRPGEGEGTARNPRKARGEGKPGVTVEKTGSTRLSGCLLLPMYLFPGQKLHTEKRFPDLLRITFRLMSTIWGLLKPDSFGYNKGTCLLSASKTNR